MLYARREHRPTHVGMTDWNQQHPDVGLNLQYLYSVSIHSLDTVPSVEITTLAL